MNYIVLLIIGCMIGSFVNVLIDRENYDINLIIGRSHCDVCHHLLTFYYLIPIVSYMMLKGRCRYCHTRLSKRMPCIEMLGGILAVVVGKMCYCWFDFIVFYSFMMILLAISIIDYQRMIIPDSLNLVLLILSLIYCFKYHLFDVNHVVGMVLIPLLMLLMNRVYKESIGGGDIKLFISIGLLLGYYQVIITFLLASTFTLLFSFFKKHPYDKPIAFGPFIALATTMILMISLI